MKKVRKSLFVLFALVFFISFITIPSYAINSNEFETSRKAVINEWDEYNRLISMTDSELKLNGFSSDKISQIRNFDYEAEIRKRAALDDLTLCLYGYTNDEIDQLRKAAAMKDIPENTIRAISTSTLTSVLRYMTNGVREEGNSDMYYVTMSYAWQWNRIPLFRVIDMVAVAFASSTSNNFTYYADNENFYVETTLSPVTTASSATYYQKKDWQFNTVDGNSISASFAIGLFDSNNDLTHFAYSGYGHFQLTNRSSQARLYIDASYGHTTINAVPAYSVNSSGISVGIDFRIGMDEQHCTGYFFEDFTITQNYIYNGTIYGKTNTNKGKTKI